MVAMFGTGPSDTSNQYMNPMGDGSDFFASLSGSGKKPKGQALFGATNVVLPEANSAAQGQALLKSDGTYAKLGAERDSVSFSGKGQKGEIAEPVDAV